MRSRALSCAALAALALGGALVPSAAAGSVARRATGSQRAAIVASFAANDGSASQVHGVYVSRSDPGLAVVCARTPEAGTRAYLFRRRGRAWHFLLGGRVGRVGDAAQRRLERVCH